VLTSTGEEWYRQCSSFAILVHILNLGFENAVGHRNVLFLPFRSFIMKYSIQCQIFLTFVSKVMDIIMYCLEGSLVKKKGLQECFPAICR